MAGGARDVQRGTGGEEACRQLAPTRHIQQQHVQEDSLVLQPLRQAAGQGVIRVILSLQGGEGRRGRSGRGRGRVEEEVGGGAVVSH